MVKHYFVDKNLYVLFSFPTNLVMFETVLEINGRFLCGLNNHNNPIK
jgi:hypothetical protein